MPGHTHTAAIYYTRAALTWVEEEKTFSSPPSLFLLEEAGARGVETILIYCPGLGGTNQRKERERERSALSCVVVPRRVRA